MTATQIANHTRRINDLRNHDSHGTPVTITTNTGFAAGPIQNLTARRITIAGQTFWLDDVTSVGTYNA